MSEKSLDKFIPYDNETSKIRPDGKDQNSVTQVNSNKAQIKLFLLKGSGPSRT